MKIDISNKTPYSAVIDIITDLTRSKEGHRCLNEKIVWLKTTVLGETKQLLLIDDDMEYVWENDWYEGGEVELLGFIDTDAVNVPLLED